LSFLKDPLPGTLAPASKIVDIKKLVSAYYENRPDPSIRAHKVHFGTSGHRGSSFEHTFNEAHVLAITQAICNYRRRNGINGPLFLGKDTHALSEPAAASVLEVLAANQVEVMISYNDEFTPTPVISHAILNHNRGIGGRLADGIVVTPSHNPPTYGGIKYNPTNGGPAGSNLTDVIQAEGNLLLERALSGVKRLTYQRALTSATTYFFDYLQAYVADLGQVIDMQLIHESKIRIGVDPLGGAGVRYWGAIADYYDLDLTVMNDLVDPTFSFMPLDWDGNIRMDPASKYAMQFVIEKKDNFDICVACDPDHDRHGIVTPNAGLMPANHYQSVALDYLLRNRPDWGADVLVGKSMVNTQMIERVATSVGKRIYEVPVGFKWYADGLLNNTLAYCSEESAGATFMRRNGTCWTTDKDGITSGLLAAEITAGRNADPGDLYAALEYKFGGHFSNRIDVPATNSMKMSLGKLSSMHAPNNELANNSIVKTLTLAAGNGASFGGVKLVTKQGWLAARPSGTEPFYKIYAESFSSESHLAQMIKEAQAMIDAAISVKPT
jgi:phosphoglucomutase